MKFIDISSNNNFIRTKNSYQVIADAIDGVIEKVSQGSEYTFTQSHNDLVEFSSLGKKTAIYHYVNQFDNLEAANFASNIVQNSIGIDLEFCMIDIETISAFKSLTKESLDSFVADLKFSLDNIVLYYSYSMHDIVSKVWSGKVIIADWTNELEAENSAKNIPNCIGVQYTDKANINGYIFDEYDIFDSVVDSASEDQNSSEAPNIPVTDPSIDNSTVATSTTENTSVTEQAATLGELTTVDIDTTKVLKFSTYELNSDSSGNAWISVNIPFNNIMNVIAQGSFPPIDGYWNIPKIAMQERITGSGVTCITFNELKPNSTFRFFITYYA